MNFSRLRHRITLLEPNGFKRNAAGERVPCYKPFKSVWAFVFPKTGREYDESQKLRAETTYNVFLRYNPDVSPDMRILWNDKELMIESVLNIDGRNEEIQLVAFERSQRGEKNGQS